MPLSPRVFLSPFAPRAQQGPPPGPAPFPFPSAKGGRLSQISPCLHAFSLDFSALSDYNETSQPAFWRQTFKEVLFIAYVISSDCIACGACEGECPVGAISNGGDKYVINPDLCIECGACAGVCPMGAPVKE